MPTLLHSQRVQRYLKGRFLCVVPERENCLALTFDDGPNPTNTPRLLDLLASKAVPATFFVVGKWLDRYGDITRRAHAEGHEIANHSHSHLPLSLLPDVLVRREIVSTGEKIEQLTGQRPRYFRPPMGWFGARLLRIIQQLGYVPVLGVAHPEDSGRPAVDTILTRVRPRLEHGAVVILHDGGWRPGVDRSPTIEAVDRLTDECLEAGRQFVTVHELASGSRWDLESDSGSPA